MADFSKIAYYDLRWEQKHKRIPEFVERASENQRLSRVIGRNLQHHAIISAPSGSGKTAYVLDWARSIMDNEGFKKFDIILLDASSLQKIAQLPVSSLSQYQEAFLSMENCIIILDSFGEMIYQSLQALQNWNTLIKPLFTKESVRLILTMQPDELQWLQDNKNHFLSHFEVVKLDTQDEAAQLEILKKSVGHFFYKTPLTVETRDRMGFAKLRHVNP